MDRWHGRVAVVSGASAGIGAAIATKLLDNGLQVVGIARRLDKLQQLSSHVNFKAFQTDITQESDLVQLFDWLKTNYGTVDILINNAGVARPVTLLDGATDEFRKVLETNVLALTVMTREAVKLMNGINGGHIININSTAGHYINNDIPCLNVYPASKFAVTALTETLRGELLTSGKSNIKVTSLSPGFVETEIVSINGFLQNKVIAKIVENAPRLYPNDIADAVLYILGTPDHVQISELIIRPTGSVH